MSWKSKVLSFVGRGVLVKTVAQSIPFYAMQTHLLSVKTCLEIDSLTRDFWWGKREEENHTLYLKAWNSICTPKEAGGLGFRRARDTNIAFITKLVWQLNTREDKLWVRLLRSKLLGRNFLDDLPKIASCSRLWSSISNFRDYFLKGACLNIKRHSSVRIKADPWIPGAAGFKLSANIPILENLTYVKDLMHSDRQSWNLDLIQSLVPGLCESHSKN